MNNDLKCAICWWVRAGACLNGTAITVLLEYRPTNKSHQQLHVLNWWIWLSTNKTNNAREEKCGLEGRVCVAQPSLNMTHSQRGGTKHPHSSDYQWKSLHWNQRFITNKKCRSSPVIRSQQLWWVRVQFEKVVACEGWLASVPLCAEL